LPPEFFLGKTPAETGMTAAATLAWEPLMQQAFATGQPRRFEFEFPAPDGTQFYQTQFVPEFDRNGAIVSVLSITRDVTESKQAEQAMRQSEAQLRQQTEELKQVNRLKDEFLAVLSHELRSPLNAILGWAQVLRNRQYKDTTLAQALETIERNARLQTQLIEDLLDISRIIRGKLILQSQPTNLAQVIAAAIDTVRLAAEAKSIQIVPLLDPAIDPVSGDAGRLQQVVWNLLSNAIKFTPSGGRVEVKLKSYEVALEHPASSEPTSPTALPTPNPEFPNSFAQITIRDTGIGIPPEFLPHIFDSFRQADGSSTRSYGGLGLGLAIVRHLVELHGGTVTAASAGTNQGTTFTVNLPLMPNGSRSPANLDTLAIARLQFPSLQDVRVLVVDDEADSREFLIFLLEEAGAIVTAVTSAKAALEVLASFKPNVLVSDIGMPREDGYRLIRQVRSLPINQGGNVPAIAVTAYAGAKNRDDAIAAGFQVHLAKPIQPADLVTAIANLR
jgi:signal transduction histidine kinase